MEIISVEKITRAIKSNLEMRFANILVKAEIVMPRKSSTGHMYFTLRENSSNLNAVIWQRNLNTITHYPTHGTKALCSGKLSTYGAKSEYILHVDSVELLGYGDLIRMINATRKRLDERGVFATIKKQPSVMPKKVALLTSAQGSVLYDMVHRLKYKTACEIILIPITVQGEETVSSILNALDIAQQKYADIAIIARGGGSFIDLMPFNDESLCIHVAQSNIPIIAAIGHQPDNVLLNYAAASYAPTPTAAIECFFQNMSDCLSGLLSKVFAVQRYIRKYIAHAPSMLPKCRIPHITLKPFDFILSIEGRMKTLILYKIATLKNLSIKPPFVPFYGNYADVQYCSLVSILRSNLENLTQLVDNGSYISILRRGFCMCTSEKRPIFSKKQALRCSLIKLDFHDGCITVKNSTVHD